jgi:hypothetical protein
VHVGLATNVQTLPSVTEGGERMLIGTTWITLLILVHAMMQGFTCTLAALRNLLQFCSNLENTDE